MAQVSYAPFPCQPGCLAAEPYLTPLRLSPHAILLCCSQAVRIETISRSAAQQLSDNLMQVCAAYAPLYKIRQAKALEITRMQIRSLREAQQDNTAHAKGKLAALERVERDQALRRVAAVRQQRSMGKGSSSGGANSGDGLGGKAGPQRVRSRSMAAAPTSPLDMGADELGRYDTHLGRRRSRGASIVNGLVNGVASLFGRQRLVDDEAIRQSDEAETRAMEARHTQALQVYEPPPPRPPPPPCVPDKRVTDGGIADEGIHRDDGECEPDLFQGLALVPTPAPGQRRHTNPFLTPPPGSITGTGSSRGSSSAPAAGAPGGNPFKLPGAPPTPASRATMAPAAGTTTGGHLLDM